MTPSPCPRSARASRRPPRPARYPIILFLSLLAPALLAACALLPARAAALVEFDFEQRFFFEPGTYIKDHTLLEHGGRIHLFYIVGHRGQGWSEPGNEVDFGHASSEDLVHWQIHDRVIPIDVATWKNRNVWAPHVVADGEGGFIMAYTGVDSSITQRIGIARSSDLFDWVDFSVESAAYAPDTTWALWSPGSWSNCRDGFLRRLPDQSWMLLSTASARPEYAGSERGAVALAFSADGLVWTDAGAPLLLNDSPAVIESPFIYTRDDVHYLLFTEGGVQGLQVTTSDSLLSGWDVTQAQIVDQKGFAGEIVDAGGVTWLSRVRGVDYPDSTVGRGALIDTLFFAGGQLVTGKSNLLWKDWTQVPGGTAFTFQPTFEDRPFGRTGVHSGLEGNFWINSAESYAEPVGFGDPDSPPLEFRVGVLRSRTFAVEGDSLELLVGGGNDPDLLYAALRRADDETLLFSETGTGGDLLTRHVWDLTGLPAGTEVLLEIADLSATGHIDVDAIREFSAGTTSVADPAGGPPRRARLRAAPNPSRLPTIRYQLPGAARVRLDVHDASGRRVRLLYDAPQAAGLHRQQWDGRLDSGRRAPSGVYFIRLAAGTRVETARVILVR